MTSPVIPRILVVDDEIGFRDLCKDLLEEVGYITDTAEDGEKALLLLEKDYYQLVLSDINMPRMDGLELLKTAKTKYPSVEVILMTAYGALQSAVEALRLGAYDYITKPFRRDVLLASVRRCLEKQHLMIELRTAQGALIKKEKLAALGTMSGWLAHRMRNPLNVILMCAQYLKTKLTDKDGKEVSTAIEEKVKVLEKMTRDFIEFSRSYEPHLKPEEINTLLDQVLETFESSARLQKVKIKTLYADALPKIPLDRDLMDEVFGYLIDNAIEAMEGSGELEVKIGETSHGVYVDISNSGPVIPEEIRKKLFDPFFTTKERGTGLGLAISRRVVESHGGEINIIGKNRTTFRIELLAPQKESKKEVEN